MTASDSLNHTEHLLHTVWQFPLPLIKGGMSQQHCYVASFLSLHFFLQEHKGNV